MKFAFDKFCSYLQEFDLVIQDKKGGENADVDHLSRLKRESEIEEDKMPVNENFPDEYLMVINSVKKEPWYADLGNFLASNT